MWKGPNEDPGGSESGEKDPPPPQELQDLKDQYEQQKMLIAQLKEMLRKSDQTSVTQEKVAEYASTLTKMSARAKRNQKEGGKKGDGPASERILLLRQQLEQNKVKLAERGKNQKGMEEMVTQIKAQLDDSQHLISQTPLNVSLIEDRVEYTPNTNSQELYNILLNKDKRINDLVTKIGKLEGNVLDLQENIKEKDSVIDARTKAITLMSENLSKKGKNTLDALEETKQQMRKMQEDFVKMEEGMKEENQKLIAELEKKDEEIKMKDEEIVQLKTEKEELSTQIKEEVKPPSRSNSKRGKKGKARSPSVDKVGDLEKTIRSQSETIVENERILQEKEEAIKMLEINLEESKNKVIELEETLVNERKALKHADTDFNIENPELIKLKQQLDESNKNMIKVKAQHKSKLKELNKKIDAFKKMGDVNAEVVRLGDENSKLNQRIAELEEEKGQLQLSMVESKESVSSEDVKELETKLSETKEEIRIKCELIDTLQKQKEEQQVEIDALKEKLECLSSIQSDQVKSDLTSIQIEEQLDKIETEKRCIIAEKEAIIQENSSLHEKLEAIKKEKEEISSKLDVYMQENIELMDKLEKLSAEKVSSAESIEIVENLTHQEKLELEEYQKSLSRKSIENLDENPDLNDSVHQLTEETSELLQKIELFTVERREVMEKMEALTAENNQLNFKIKEIENNRDVLVETYEQVQTEKEELDGKIEEIEKKKVEIELKVKSLEEENNHLKNQHGSTAGPNEIEEYKMLIEIQKQEIMELKVELLAQKQYEATNDELKDQIDRLQTQYTALLNENEKLKSSEINDQVQKRIEDFESKLKDNLEEIENYKSILEENKDELIKSSNIINDLQTKLKEKSEEIEHYENEVIHLNSVIEDLNGAIQKLEEENQENIEKVAMSSELNLLKESLKENLEQLQDYEKEFQQNSETINLLNAELKSLNYKIKETENLLEEKDNEMQLILQGKEAVEKELKEKDESFHKTCNDLKEKCLKLQSQIEQNTGSYVPLETKVDSLEKKNKEQLEKMKKIAANLKKKTLEYKELESKHEEVREKWENEVKEKEILSAKLEESNQNLNTTLSQLQEVESEFSKINASLKEKVKESDIIATELSEIHIKNNSLIENNSELTEQIHHYSAQIEDLQNIKHEYEIQINSLCNEMELLRSTANNTSNTELSQKDEVISDLQEQLQAARYNAETSSNALQIKIQELEMYIETQELELQKNKERVAKLEEGLSLVEKRRLSLEQKTIELGSELKAKEISLTESEDYLEERLKSIQERDETFENHLKKVTELNFDLEERNQALECENDSIKKQFNLLNNKLKESEEELYKLKDLESENAHLNDLVSNLEGELKRAKSELRNITFESERNENDLQEQLEQLTIERKLLMEQFEVSRDQVVALTRTQEEMSSEIAELNAKLDQQQIVFDENISRYQSLENEHKKTLTHIDRINSGIQENVTVKTVQPNLAEMFKAPGPKSAASFFDDPAPSASSELERNINLLEQEKRDLINKLQESMDELGETKSRMEFLNGLIKQNEESNLNISGRNAELEQQYLTLQSEYEREKMKNEEEKSVFEQQILILRSELENIDVLKQEKLEVENQLEVLRKELEDLKISAQESSNLLQENSRLSTELMNLQVELQNNRGVNTFNNQQNLVDPISFFDNPNINDELIELKSQLQFARNMLQQTEEYNLNILGQNDELEKRIIELQTELEAMKTKPAQSETSLPWPQSEEESSNSKEELQQKIKTLEFMLFNIEKEKDNTLLQCHELSNELTRLIYERENKPVSLEIKAEASSIPAPDSPDLIEEPCVSKTVNLLYPDNNKPADAFGENDDGWGCNPDDIKLEQEYIAQTSNSTPQIPVLEERIRVLEVERERILEELNQSKIKCGKLIKKLKEFKVKNEQLSAKMKTDDLGDLNDAIQDELKMQIENLEKRLKESGLELKKERTEKDALLKRIDVLSSANERMVEMKEKQDVEIMSWQHRNRELTAKLEQLEWGDDNFENKPVKGNSDGPIYTSDELNSKVQELNDQIKELTLDNEELQVMLEEQRNLRLEAEKLKSVQALPENMKSEDEYNTILAEKQKLLADLQNAEEKVREISNQLQVNYAEKTQLEAAVLENNITIETLNQQLLQIGANQSDSNELKQKLDLFENEKLKLISENKNLSDQLNQEINSKVDFHNKIKSLESERDELLLTVTQLQQEVEDLKVARENLLEQLESKVKEVVREDEIQERINAAAEQMAAQWSQLVDQRGNDVAESWKLHLESRENEFIQVEQQLQKEIKELEEKCNGLVNENNELRKNVDTEIQNEVDRISALQQQINDRQIQIDQLNFVLQEKQNEISHLYAENEKLIENLKSKDLDCEKLIQENTKISSLQEELVNSKNLIDELTRKVDNTSKEGERTLSTLQLDLHEKENELRENKLFLDDYKNQLEQYKLKLSSMEGILQERDYKISELNMKFEEQNKENLNAANLQQLIQEYQQQVTNFNTQLQESYLYNQTLLQDIENYKALNEHIQSKEEEINRLNTLLQEKECEYEYNLQSRTMEIQSVINEQVNEIDSLKKRLQEEQFNHEEILNTKEAESESYKSQLQEYISMKKNEETDLVTSLHAEISNLQHRCMELDEIVREDEKQLIELKSIIEDQVLKIEQLNKELYEKSSNYDALVAQLSDPQDLPKVQKSVHFESSDKEEDQEPVSRAELDVALYMLHQRDVRCEELTVELMQLLEERDTLQLRLSNAIREKEQLRSTTNIAESNAEDVVNATTPKGAIPKSKAIILGATGTELAAEATENITGESLAHKLSELKSVGYHKDKTLLDEQEIRRIQQYSILQQHKDEMAKLPPEAAARLVDANYTLSRDVQSQSKVLLNWLWGRSTPKVNNV